MVSCLGTTYIYLIVGLILLILGIALFRHFSIQPTNVWWYLAIFIGILVLLWITLSQAPGPIKTILAILVILGFSLILTPLINAIPSEDLWRYLVMTVVFFGLLSFAALANPTRALSWGRILLILLILLIIVGLIGLFLFRNRTVTLIYFLAILFVFGAFILYDTSVVATTCQTVGSIDYIDAAFALLLDAINVFVGVSGVGSV
jgi:FtsH-binding integral membrane protein